MRELRDKLRQEEGDIEMKMCSECYHIDPHCLAKDRGEYLNECVLCKKEVCDDCFIIEEKGQDIKCLACGQEYCFCVFCKGCSNKRIM